MDAATLERAAKLYLDGQTLTVLSQMFGVPRSTLSFWLVRKLGKGAKHQRTGLADVLAEYKNDPRVAQWIEANRDAIRRADLTGQSRLLTRRQEQAIANRETGRASLALDHWTKCNIEGQIEN